MGQIIIFSRRSACRVYQERCATLGISVLEFEIILNRFSKDARFGPPLNPWKFNPAWNSFELQKAWVKNSRWCLSFFLSRLYCCGAAVFSASESYPMLNSPVILWKKIGQPATNCNRRFFNGFRLCNVFLITYQKSQKIPLRGVAKKRDLL